MALSNTFRELDKQLESLKETLDGLRCLLPDDPLNTEVVLMQHLRESVDGVKDWLDECLAQSQLAQAALDQTLDMNNPRRALIQCQAIFDDAERASLAELLSYEKLREVLRLGFERRGVWLIWSQSIKRDFESCRYKLCLTRKALTACWQELAEHAEANVSSRTPSVRQRMTAAAPGVGDLEVEGIP